MTSQTSWILTHCATRFWLMCASSLTVTEHRSFWQKEVATTVTWSHSCSMSRPNACLKTHWWLRKSTRRFLHCHSVMKWLIALTALMLIPTLFGCSLGTGIVGHVALSKQNVNIEDAYEVWLTRDQGATWYIAHNRTHALTKTSTPGLATIPSLSWVVTVACAQGHFSVLPGVDVPANCQLRRGRDWSCWMHQQTFRQPKIH